MFATVDSLHFEHPRGFVVLEGVNGAGKSTLRDRLQAFLVEKVQRVVCTFEPGATSQGKELRKALLSHSAGKLAPLSELFLFAADRHEHVTQIIDPAIKRGEFVLCDRYLYSTLVFQGYGRGLDLAAINTLNDLAVCGTLPDLVLLLDLDPLEGLARTKARASAGTKNSGPTTEDAFEREHADFQHRLRDGFLKIAKERPEPFIVIDASLSADEVFRVAAKALTSLLQAKLPQK